MASKTTPIAVLGAGAWGTALALVLTRNGHTVRLWDVDRSLIETMQMTHEQSARLPGISFPDQLHPTLDITDAVDGVRDICLVVPSFAFRSVLQDLKSLVSSAVRFVWGTKGLSSENAGFLSDLVSDVFSERTPAAVLSGPSFAKEVAMQLPTAVTIAGNDAIFLSDLKTYFQNTHFSVALSDDMIGAQLCGVVKNVIAIATGISDGLQYGANMRCALITQGLTELSHLCVALGGQRDTVMCVAGVGDMVLTCTDNQSRNRRLGLALGQGMSIEAALKQVGQSVEGYYNAQQLCQLAERYHVDMPIVKQVHGILYRGEIPSLSLAASCAK